jgi:voltage-gated potassium channel
MEFHGLKRRLVTIVVAILATIVIGTVGFIWIEGYSFFDALYMSLITITTVGYEEIHPLGRAGRIFNTFLLVFGVGVMFYAIGAMTQTIIELQLGEYFEKRRMRRMIEKLKDHYIVCGFGRVGQSAAEELQRANEPFVLVDGNSARVDRAAKHGMLAVDADAKSDETLLEVGVERAKGLIAALGTDADNLFLILSAKSLNPALKVSSRVNEETSENKLKMAGADAVFRPYNITGFRLAQAILRPYVFEFLDFTSSTVSLGQDIALEQVHVPENSVFGQKSLKELPFRRDMNVIVLAIRKADGEMQFNPDANALVEVGDHLVVMGSLDHLHRLTQMFGERAA